MDGKKKYETRDNSRLKALIGKRIHIIRTGTKMKAKAIGAVTIGKPLEVGKEQFDEMRSDPTGHRVPHGSEYDIKDGGQ